MYDYMPNGSVDKLLFGNHVKPQDSPAGRSIANRRLEETVSLKDFVVDVAVPKFPWERRYVHRVVPITQPNAVEFPS